MIKKFQLFFQGQGVHYGLLLFFLVGVLTVVQEQDFLSGQLGGIPTTAWFWAAVLSPIIHQTYVWLCWRAELHYGFLTRIFGRNAFNFYASGFFALLVSRLIFVCLLAYANQETLSLNRTVTYALMAFFSVPMAYVYYSIARYFGFRRAAGMDHFDPAYRNKALAKEGAFKYFRNPIYLFGLFILFIPGLLLSSKAALLVAIFQFGYIWIHYFCTEKPDMRVIYGEKTI